MLLQGIPLAHIRLKHRRCNNAFNCYRVEGARERIVVTLRVYVAQQSPFSIVVNLASSGCAVVNLNCIKPLSKVSASPDWLLGSLTDVGLPSWSIHRPHFTVVRDYIRTTSYYAMFAITTLTANVCR